VILFQCPVSRYRGARRGAAATRCGRHGGHREHGTQDDRRGPARTNSGFGWSHCAAPNKVFGEAGRRIVLHGTLCPYGTAEID